MKRKALLRRTPLKRSRKPIAVKGKRRFKKGEDQAFLAWIREQPCVLMGRDFSPSLIYDKSEMWGERWRPHVCCGAVEAAHIRSKGAGGADRDNTLPVDAGAHGLQHRFGIKSWAKAYGFKDVDELKQLAAGYVVRYEREVEHGA